MGVTFLLSSISNRIRKNVPPSFSSGFGRSPNPGLAGDSKPRGAPSSLVQVDSPVHGPSAGGLQEASCQKQGEGEGFLHGHPPLS